jgi:hypothetical protein
MKEKINVKDAAKFLKISVTRVHQLCREGKLDATKKSGKIEINKKSLEAWQSRADLGNFNNIELENLTPRAQVDILLKQTKIEAQQLKNQQEKGFLIEKKKSKILFS